MARKDPARYQHITYKLMKKLLYPIITGTAFSIVAVAIPFAASARSQMATAHAQIATTNNSATASSTMLERCDIPFGHLIAPGWLKKNGHATTTVPNACIFPFGIGMKLHATSTGSTTSPATSTRPFALRIRDVDTSVASSTATIDWRTNAASDSIVYYSTLTPVTVGASTTASVSSADKVYGHEVKLGGLATSTTYYFIVKSTDVHGDTATSSELHLTTRSM
jgi:hypothetical protein